MRRSPAPAAGRPSNWTARPRRLAREPALQQRFKRETKAIAALSHANIVGIYDVGRDRGLTYAVTEFLEGESLHARLKSSSIEWREGLGIGIAVADGLAAAHDKGIIHRDIKPGNIFLPSSGGVRILDFGLARLDGSGEKGPIVEDAPTASFETSEGKLLGTVAYMSPEQVRGRTADARSDIFSLGCVLHELLGGRPPFSRPTGAETMAAILKDDPPELAAHGDEMPVGMDRLVAHCLEREPAARFQSARDLAFALRGITEG